MDVLDGVDDVEDVEDVDDVEDDDVKDVDDDAKVGGEKPIEATLIGNGICSATDCALCSCCSFIRTVAVCEAPFK